MKLENKNDIKTVEYIRRNFEINAGEMVVSDGSVLIIDDKERRWRLPLGKNEFMAHFMNYQLKMRTALQKSDRYLPTNYELTTMLLIVAY